MGSRNACLKDTKNVCSKFTTVQSSRLGKFFPKSDVQPRLLLGACGSCDVTTNRWPQNLTIDHGCVRSRQSCEMLPISKLIYAIAHI